MKDSNLDSYRRSTFVLCTAHSKECIPDYEDSGFHFFSKFYTYKLHFIVGKPLDVLQLSCILSSVFKN